MRILAGLDDERAPAVTDHQPGDGAQRLLFRLRLPVDAPRRPLARRDQHATGLAGPDEGVRHVETVDHAVAGVVEVEDPRLTRAERIRDHVGRRRLHAVAGDAGEDQGVDVERADAGVSERPRGGRHRQLGWQYVRGRDPALPHPRHALEPSGLEPQALQSRALLDLDGRDHVGWNFGSDSRDADPGAVRVHGCRHRVGHERRALLSLA